jgi:hypothetical protein
MFRNKLGVLRWWVVSPRPTPKLEDHPLSALRDCLFNIFAATLHIWRPSPASATWGRAMPWWQGTHLTWLWCHNVHNLITRIIRKESVVFKRRKAYFQKFPSFIVVTCELVRFFDIILQVTASKSCKSLKPEVHLNNVKKLRSHLIENKKHLCYKNKLISLMLFKGIIAVYFDHFMKHIRTVREQNADFGSFTVCATRTQRYRITHCPT